MPPFQRLPPPAHATLPSLGSIVGKLWSFIMHGVHVPPYLYPPAPPHPTPTPTRTPCAQP